MLLNSNIISTKTFTNLVDNLNNNIENTKLEQKFKKEFVKLFENEAAYNCFMSICQLISYCVPRNEKLQEKYNLCLTKISLIVIGKEEIFDEDGQMIINFNALEKDYYQYCIDSCSKIINMFARTYQRIQKDDNGDYDFEKTISCKTSRNKSFKDISRYFRGESQSHTLSKIGSLTSSVHEKSFYSAIIKEDKLIVEMLHEILVKANDGQVKIDNETDEILVGLFELLDRKFNLNVSADNKEAFSELSVYSKRSGEQKKNMLQRTRKMHSLLESFINKREENMILIDKESSLNKSVNLVLFKTKINKHLKMSSSSLSIMSNKMSSSNLKSLSQNKTTSIRGKNTTQNQLKTSIITELSSMGSKHVISQNSNHVLLSKECKSDDKSSRHSKHENRFKQRKLSLFDNKEELK